MPSGAVTTGADVDYRGQQSGYTKDPQEAINYISKHDNETIWDISQYKHATGTALAERVRADNVGMSVIMLAQGIPFLQAGTEILRSKSMDRNSYDSGDWYNEIDWTLATSKWNQGLPRAADNAGQRRAGEERHPRRDRGAGPGGPPGGARELQGTARDPQELAAVPAAQPGADRPAREVLQHGSVPDPGRDRHGDRRLHRAGPHAGRGRGDGDLQRVRRSADAEPVRRARPGRCTRCRPLRPTRS